jgi:hypothetical protein
MSNENQLDIVNSQPDTFWRQRFLTKKSLTKRLVASLRPGAFLQIKWMDSPDQAVMLLEKVDYYEHGELSIHVFDGKTTSRHPVYSQVIEAIGHVDSLNFTEARSIVHNNLTMEMKKELEA